MLEGCVDGPLPVYPAILYLGHFGLRCLHYACAICASWRSIMGQPSQLRFRPRSPSTINCFWGTTIVCRQIPLIRYFTSGDDWRVLRGMNAAEVEAAIALC